MFIALRQAQKDDSNIGKAVVGDLRISPAISLKMNRDEFTAMTGFFTDQSDALGQAIEQLANDRGHAVS